MLFLLIIYFILGTISGSFLFASVYRLKHKMPILNGRSECTYCHHILSFFDLIPLLSFVFLKGKCRYCKSKISYEYFTFELFCALVFVLAGLSIQNKISFSIISNSDLIKIIFNYIYVFFLVSVFIFFALYDLKYRLILNKVLFPLIGLFYLYRTAHFLYFYFSQGIVQYSDFEALLSALIATFLFFMIVFITKERGMGWGDVKFVFFMGIVLGFPGILISLYISFIAGALYGVILLVLKRGKLTSSVPFAPFLSLGSVIFLLYGDILIKEYLKYFLLT